MSDVTTVLNQTDVLQAFYIWLVVKYGVDLLALAGIAAALVWFGRKVIPVLLKDLDDKP